MNPRTHHWIPPLLGTVLLLGSMLACSLGDLTGSGNQPDPTLTALSQRVALTATAAGQQGSSQGNDLATAQARATATSQVVLATQTSSASLVDVSQQATATIAAPVLAELPFYGVDETQGHVGWMHPPVTLEMTGYQEVTYANDFMGVTAADFVLAADIAWDTQYGSSGCGYMFRSDGNQNKPNQYMIIATRFGNGRVVFTAIADGEPANLREFYPKEEDRSFQWQNGTKNRVAIVARGNIIELYTNQVKVGEIDTTQPPKALVLPPPPEPPTGTADKLLNDRYQAQLKEYEEISSQVKTQYAVALDNFEKEPAVFTDGFLAMIALSESGRTVCTFENAWLWIIDQ